MGAFVCQISERDWLISREIGVYGNREGSERGGRVVRFAGVKGGKGEQVIQSIVEDLLGMRKGDTVFFHVLGGAEGESSIHGVYRVREEPLYNEVKLWNSSPYLSYPYRFCFEPHWEHIELCRYDASILVSEFYKLVENRNIRSVLTLEREVRGPAHAVKSISTDDAQEIVKLLYRDFSSRCAKEAVEFRPAQMSGPSLRSLIRGIGKIEFAIKALIAYGLGQRDPSLIRWIPACRSAKYDFLIESFVGQTARKPTDILCISSGGPEKAVTVVEAKTDLVQMDDLIQAIKYQEFFKLRNIDKGGLSYRMSICLLGQRFHQELINYVSVRRVVLPWEEIVLLKYTPTEGGTNATFGAQGLALHVMPVVSKGYPQVDIRDLASELQSSPGSFCAALGNKIPPRTEIEFKRSEDNLHILARYYTGDGGRLPLGYVLICHIDRTCVLEDLSGFMSRVYEQASRLQGDLMAIDPILVARNYDNSAQFFIDRYNACETRAGRRPICAYIVSGG